MAGTPDVTTNYDRKTELDFRNRLIAKFAIARAKKFWNSGFDAMPATALYPDDDRIEQLCKSIPSSMWSYLPRTDRPREGGGELILEWARVEEQLLDEARRLTERNVPVGRAIHELVKRGRLAKEVAAALHRVRRVRNTVAHTPSRVEPNQIARALSELRETLPRLRFLRVND